MIEVQRSVLVTGAGGFVGRHLVDALHERGDRVWGTRAAPGSAGTAVGSPGALRWVHADMTVPASVDEAVSEARPDVVFHLAGGRRVAGGALDVLNVGGLDTLLRAVAGWGSRRGSGPGVRILVAGSAAEYGSVPEEALPIREDGPLFPVDDYGRSKAEATRRGLELAERLTLDVVVARIFNVTGPGEPASLLFGRLAFEITRAERVAGEAAGVVEIAVGSLGATRDLIDVRDAARALLLVADRAERGTVVNVGRGIEERVRDHAERLRARSRVRVGFVEAAVGSPAGPARHVADVSRLAALGFRAQVALEASAEDLLEEMRSRP